MLRALDAFPFPEMACRIWKKYFIPGGKPSDAPYSVLPMHQQVEPHKLMELCIAANFVEVFLAKEGHENPVGINYLEKIQLPHLASIYGAMLAGVDYVLMGAGIPLSVPGVLDAYVAHQPAEYKLAVTGAAADLDVMVRFDPAEYAEGPLPVVARPKFLAIVSSNTLAVTMLRRASGRVDGLVVEGSVAGGHNAPPRGKMQLNATGEPVYGQRDQVNLEELRSLGAPFWLAGGYGSADKLNEALQAGAAGVQVGTAFALSEESGLRDDLKEEIIAQVLEGTARVFTDPHASPTGFPFKVAKLPGTLSEDDVYLRRERKCDLGFLRELYATPDGKIGYRCAGEPVQTYVAKGGKVEDTVGRKCLCNALISNIGHAQIRKDGTTEPELVTVGDDVNKIAQFLAPGRTSYSAMDVVKLLLSKIGVEQPVEVLSPA